MYDRLAYTLVLRTVDLHLNIRCRQQLLVASTGTSKVGLCVLEYHEMV